MANGKSTWKYNKLLTGRRNYFDLGGDKDTSTGHNLSPGYPNNWYPYYYIDDKNWNIVKDDPSMNKALALQSSGMYYDDGDPKYQEAFKKWARNAPFWEPELSTKATPEPIPDKINPLPSPPAPTPSKFKSFMSTDLGKGITSAVGSAVGSIGGGLISNGMTSTAGNVIGGLQNIAGAIPGPWGAVTSAGLGVIGGLANRMFGSKMNEENIAKVEGNINQLNNFSSNASSYDTLASSWGNAPVGMNFDNSYIGKDGWFSHKAKDKANELRNQVTSGNLWVQNSLMNNANNLREDQMNNMVANYSAFGGPLFAMGGKFSTSGGEFTNGLTYIGNGGSHETNPLQGVPMGVDPEGNPNLVEEGETIFNDYVFSKRLKVPRGLRGKYKLSPNKELSFAEMSKELAKESDERPNDPISINGLRALMGDLAANQEMLKDTQTRRQEYSMGGRLFGGGGDKGNQTLDHDNSTPNLYFGLSRDVFNPYNDDGTINWDIMYKTDSPYIKRRQYVLDHWDDPSTTPWKEKYVEGINNYNKNRKGYIPMTVADLTKDIFEKRTLDKLWGGMHAGLDYAGDPEEKLIIEHKLRGKDGALTDMPQSDIYYADADFNTGKTWEERFKDKYTRVNNGDYVETVDPEKHTRTRRYFYDPVVAKSIKDRYYIKGDDGYTLVEGDNPYLQIQNKGNYTQVKNNGNDLGGIDYYYDPEEVQERIAPLPTWMRYTPTVGLGIGAITDALGVTNKPDYSNADAILAASAGAGTYQPVRYNPVGNYLSYRPFDREFALNQMNATAGATRRNLVNTAGGNRSTAMAGLLASDNNYLNQVGTMARQAEEYNFNQRKEVEDFNRATNSANSQGFLTADTANQNALANLRDFRLRGITSAADLREKARLSAEAAKSANLSGFLTSLGDIGRENVAWNWRNFGLNTASFNPIQEEDMKNLGYTSPKKKETQKSTGGYLKKRKGLTY